MLTTKLFRQMRIHPGPQDPGQAAPSVGIMRGTTFTLLIAEMDKNILYIALSGEMKPSRILFY